MEWRGATESESDEGEVNLKKEEWQKERRGVVGAVFLHGLPLFFPPFFLRDRWGSV